MLVQFAIWPEDRPHMHEDVQRARKVLTDAGVTFQVGPMGTTIEGSWDEAMDAIGKCHQAASERHERVLTTITIDDDRVREQSISKNMEKVGEIV